jgi:hypothetical protein
VDNFLLGRITSGVDILRSSPSEGSPCAHFNRRMSAGMISPNLYPISCCDNGFRSMLATVAIRKSFRSRHWIVAALHLGFLGMTGTTLRSLEYVPAAVLRHLGRQFRQPVPDIATLRTLYRRRLTRFAHQRWAIKQWGLREFDPAIEQRLTEHLHSRTNATVGRNR